MQTARRDIVAPFSYLIGECVSAVQIQNRIIAPTLSSDQPLKAPWILRHLKDIPILRDLPARAIGLGVRPEHIETPGASGGQ